MAKGQSYPKEFIDSVISKILSGQGRSISSVAKEMGLSTSTVHGWLSKRGKVSGMKNSKTSKTWSAQEQLKAVNETSSMTEEELGVYLRSHGLYSHELNEWRKKCLGGLESSGKPMKASGEALRIKELEKEILRKDKALAEASALLILQKKVSLIWGNDSEGSK